MSQFSKSPLEIDAAEHISLAKTGDNIEAKRVALYIWDGSEWRRATSPLPVTLDSSPQLDNIATLLDLIEDATHAEDTSFSSSDKGVSMLAVRTDEPGNNSDADGKYEPLQMAGGRLWVAARVDNTVNTALAAALPAGTNAIGKLTQPTTPTLANVTMDGSSVTLQESNVDRRNLMIFNDSGAVVYIKLGTGASTTSFTRKMADQTYYELPDPVYTGIITAFGASGDVRVTEIV